ncbi:DNA repair helicase UVH6 [Apostasia shenzhenica]|uniref:Regulator of telomere elongation helicase 1 homolog n=1 Tax=Apostasia shenzhenica TaxID=1088818 RepID=A0A2I0AL58_9ASPA|nr:DNA repair helicase UVH6 [Apostasia shenzhenica]
MPVYKIRGIDVDFPYEAYDCQLVYMGKVIQALQEGCNALLESPTGTGKTLCLLCATLAWRKTFGEFSFKEDEVKSSFLGSQLSDSQSAGVPKSPYPVIIYSSRTHSQLKQVIRELKASNYRPRMGILGSRVQMCIHDKVQKLSGSAQNHACHSLCRRKKCHYHLNVSEFMRNRHDVGFEPFDIEELVKTGRSNDTCPYYISRELHRVVDILFAPYNYLIDPGNRRSLSGIPWSNSVLIFDEAHNLDSICADAASFDLPSSHLTACIAEAEECFVLSIEKRAKNKASDKQHDPENYAILRGLLLKLEKHISEIPIKSKDLGFTRPGHYIYEFLSDLNITFETANMLINTIENAALLREEGKTQNGVPIQSDSICRLEVIRNILKIVFRDGGKSHARFYRFHVQESPSSAADSMKGKMSRSLSWWCFNPGLAMEEFVKLHVRSIILTSGTLSPLDSCALEMNLEFPLRLENSHVVLPNQVWVGVVPSGPSGYSLNSSYRTRDLLEYKQELGNTIVNFARIVPDGLLIFFPSYFLMDQCITCWKNMGHAMSRDCVTIWERICKHKQPVIEPKQSSCFASTIEEYEAKLHDKATSGAIFFAVCRGKVSEGLDFADRTGRAVVITGIPFAMRTDPKVQLKREYLDQQSLSQKNDSKMLLTGENWYIQQAARAVNQAIGRVIRHRHDYGAIVLCDERFAQQNYQCQMSCWLRPHVKCYPNFGDVVFKLTRFFRDLETSILQKPKLMESFKKDDTEMAELEILEMDSLSGLDPHSKQRSYERFSIPLAASKEKTRGSFEIITSPSGSNLTLNQNYYLGASTRKDFFSCSNRDRRVVSMKNNYDNIFMGLNAGVQDDPKLRAEDHQEPASEKLPKKIKLCVAASNSASLAWPEDMLPLSCKAVKAVNLDRDLRTSTSVGPIVISKDEIVSQTYLSKLSSLGKEGQNLRSIHGEEASRGSAFLAQVHEKLTMMEYNEFVGFMRSLKLKSMKIEAVLESISYLFRSPERFCLLKGFEHFVPEKYRDLYGQYLRSHIAAEK